jgi:arginyl-tRNA synthetase
MNLRNELESRISQAITAAGGPGDAPAIVARSGKPQFGDYQANGCMAAAKALGTNPRQFAETVLENLDLTDLAYKVELAGPGFVNIFLRDDWLTGQLTRNAADEKLGLDEPDQVRKIVVDYSGPNLAKEMHVGHLRSTIIGDALARVLEYQGHAVIRQNHVGDWGTQFGMLLAYMRETDSSSESLADLEDFYRRAKLRFDEDETFADTARQTVVALQSGDEDCLKNWQAFLAASLGHCQEVYKQLGAELGREDVRGESFYNKALPGVIEDLQAAGLLAESQGAAGVFLDEFRNKDDERAFVIVRKSDGGYLYATTDLAALRYRSGELGAHRIIYVTDSRQAQHFAQVFLIARRAGFVPEGVQLEHVPFGMMLGDDGRPFKTRTGGTVKLMDLLEEARRRAEQMVREKNPQLSPRRAEEIARVVGIGALKYADLAQDRTSDYVFSWGKMLSLEGNTAPYMQYAYARIGSIFRKGQTGDSVDFTKAKIPLGHQAERALAVRVIQFPETIDAVAETSLPNILCAYLFDLAGAFMSFYENCPVLQARGESRLGRLALCDLTARIIKQGLALLGIETIEQM